MKGKNLQPEILYLARLLLKFEGEVKRFTDKQKIKEFSTTKLVFIRNAKGISLSRKEKATTRNMKIIKEKISLVKANIQ